MCCSQSCSDDEREGYGNKQWVPTTSIRRGIPGSVGHYFPTAHKVGACSTRRVPRSGTISSGFSFISVMKPVVPSLLDPGIHSFWVCWFELSERWLLSPYFPGFFSFTFPMFFFSSPESELIPRDTHRDDDLHGDNHIDNLKDRNTDSDFLLKTCCSYVVRAFQVLLPRQGLCKITFILWAKKLRFRKLKQFSQGHPTY